MNLVMDIGNTAVKWAAFEGDGVVAEGHGVPETLLSSADRVLACASGGDEVLADVATLRSPLEVLRAPYVGLPVQLDYKTPDTLGADRVADACGARALHPGEDCLVIDAGTCITVDFLDCDGIYHGGAIMPGIGMNLQALHTFTARLPLVEIAPGRKAPVSGRSTEESIVAGTLGAVALALAGYVALYRQRCPRLRVLLTGGDADRLAAGTAGWETVPRLTLLGLNEILKNRKL